MKGSPFKLRSPLKQDLTMDSTIGDVGNKVKKEVKEFGKNVFMQAKYTTDQIINAPKDAFNAISNTSVRDAGEGVLNSLSSGTYKAGKDLYNKMKQRDGGHDDMMKTRREPILPPGVGHDESVRRGGELRKKNQEQKTQSAGAEKSSRQPTRLELAVAKRSQKKKTDIIQPVAKIKPSSIVKNPKI